MEPDETAEALTRRLSIEEADIVLREECPSIAGDVVLTEMTALVRHGNGPSIRVRQCLLSVSRDGTWAPSMFGGMNWGAVLNEARRVFGS